MNWAGTHICGNVWLAKVLDRRSNRGSWINCLFRIWYWSNLVDSSPKFSFYFQKSNFNWTVFRFLYFGNHILWKCRSNGKKSLLNMIALIYFKQTTLQIEVCPRGTSRCAKVQDHRSDCGTKVDLLFSTQYWFIIRDLSPKFSFWSCKVNFEL